MPNKLFAANLWPMYTTQSTIDRYSRFMKSCNDAIDGFLESLLLYDEIVIPTNDFLIIPVMLNKIGEKEFRSLIENNTIKFLRLNGFIGYQPGIGASIYQIKDSNSHPKPAFADQEWLIDIMIKELTYTKDSKGLKSFIINATSEIISDNLTPIIRDESEADVKKSEHIRELFSLPDVHPHKFAEDKKKVTLYTNTKPNPSNKVVNSYLTLVQANIELYMATQEGCIDIASATNLDQFILHKSIRKHKLETQYKLKNFDTIPDFAPQIRQGSVEFIKLSKIRDSRRCKEFRERFHENIHTEDPTILGKEFKSIISDLPSVDKSKSRIFNILIRASSSVDLFFNLSKKSDLNKPRQKGSDKIFLDKFRNIK